MQLEFLVKSKRNSIGALINVLCSLHNTVETIFIPFFVGRSKLDGDVANLRPHLFGGWQRRRGRRTCHWPIAPNELSHLAHLPSKSINGLLFTNSRFCFVLWILSRLFCGAVAPAPRAHHPGPGPTSGHRCHSTRVKSKFGGNGSFLENWKQRNAK